MEQSSRRIAVLRLRSGDCSRCQGQERHHWARERACCRLITTRKHGEATCQTRLGRARSMAFEGRGAKAGPLVEPAIGS